ncbi:MAG: hypothetical protein KIC98_05000 [Clostridioides difficile]|nr:hypothetical protein [Clostridioides difficile]
MSWQVLIIEERGCGRSWHCAKVSSGITYNICNTVAFLSGELQGLL